MKRIIIHWTAGTYTPNQTDKEHYHFLIDAQGNVFNGKFKPEDNENCNDGKYAAHTGGGNTGSVGVALCAMAGFRSSFNVGLYPITKIQCERMFKLCAELSKKYNIAVENIMTHYEFGKAYPTTTSAGKIDIIYLPPYPNVRTADIGSFIRQKIKWYKQHL
jgi:N-acetyl-anhydromuramyl-L-alanine amidase AmpD